MREERGWGWGTGGGAGEKREGDRLGGSEGGGVL